MKPKIVAALVANLFAVCAAGAQEGPTFSGSVSLGGIGANIDAKDEWKAREYRDLDSGVIVDLDAKGRGGPNWIDIFGENLGRRDQFADVNGGVYGLFKGRLYVNDILHNAGLGLITPYTGAGTNSLTAPVTGTGASTTFNTDPTTWNSFDARIKRRNIGGYAEVSAGSPFYFRVDANEAQWSGIRVLSAALGPSPTYGFAELPTPTDYKVRTVSAEAGYSTRMAHVSFSLTKSKFTNENLLLNWTNPNALGATDTNVLPQDNEQTKWALNGVLKRLPFDSTLAARVTYAKTENHVNLLTGMLNTASSSAVTPTGPSVPTFDGEIVHRTASLSLTSQLTRELDTRLYWNQYKKENNSTAVVFNAGNVAPDIFSYDKKNFGIEVGYRLPKQTRLLVGFDYVDLDRDRVDFDNSKDKKAYLELKTGAWDVAAIRFRAQRLQRRSHFLEGDAGTGPNDPEFLNRFVARFDVSNVDQDLLKLAIDLTPVDKLDVGVEAIYKHNDFKDTLLGRTKDHRSEIYGTVSYGDGERWRITAFGDAELIYYDSFHRNIGTVANGPNPPAGFCTTANPNCFDPINGPSNSGSYNWSASVNERNYALGIGGDFVVNPRIKLAASYTWQKTGGTVDLSSPAFPAPFVPLVNIPNVDDIKIHTLNLKGTFKATRSIDVTAGYAYEKYDFDDQQFANYSYVVPGSSANARSYLSGLYAFPNHKTNVFYAFVTFRF